MPRSWAAKNIMDSRFVTYFDDDPEFSMIPRTSDGQLLFLLNNVSKMKKPQNWAAALLKLHNGSSLFTGDAGSGKATPAAI